MTQIASSLIAASAAIILVLGLIHLLYTFRGRMLHPRDAELHARLRADSPVITRETTMWKAWIGFNASHAFGAILFGSVYGYLAVLHSAFLYQSIFLQQLGLLLLAGYVVLGKLYWFRIPFRGAVLATALYVVALLQRSTSRHGLPLFLPRFVCVACGAPCSEALTFT